MSSQPNNDTARGSEHSPYAYYAYPDQRDGQQLHGDRSPAAGQYEPHFPARSGDQDSVVDVEAVLGRVCQDLAERFKGAFSLETVQRYVRESYELLASRARIHKFLPSLTANFAADRLTALAQGQGLAPRDVPEVLFICTQNAGRSQLAAALLNEKAGGRVHVRSAGTTPSSELDPTVVDILQELASFSATEYYPKPITDEVVQAADYVITMGCGDACAVYPGKKYLDWPIADPEGRSPSEVGIIRDDISGQVDLLLEEILTVLARRAHSPG